MKIILEDTMVVVMRGILKIIIVKLGLSYVRSH